MADLDSLQAAQTIKIAGADGSGNETTFVNATSNGELNVTNLVFASGGQAALTVGTSAIEVKVGVSALTGRKLVTVYNNSLVTIYWGRNSSVTTLNGTPIEPRQFMSFEGFSASQAIFLIASIAGNNVRITES